MSKDPVLDGLEAEMARALFAWWSRLAENAGGQPTEETIVGLLAAVVRSFYLPPEQRPDGTIDLAVRRAKALGVPLPEEPLPPVVVKLDADAVIDGVRLQRLADAMGVDGGVLVAEALRRGVASLEAEHGVDD